MFFPVDEPCRTYAVYVTDFADDVTGLEYDGRCVGDGGFRFFIENGKFRVFFSCDREMMENQFQLTSIENSFLSMLDQSEKQMAKSLGYEENWPCV